MSRMARASADTFGRYRGFLEMNALAGPFLVAAGRMDISEVPLHDSTHLSPDATGCHV